MFCRYFLHFFAPTVEIKPRRVVFVLDISGSMMQIRNKLKWAVINIITSLTEKVTSSTDRKAILSDHFTFH